MSESTLAPRTRSMGSLLTLMFFAAGIVFLDRFGITYLFPQIASDLRLDNTQLASLVSVTAVAWAVSSLLFSVLSDRFRIPAKPIIIASLILFSLSVGLVGLAPNYGTLILLRALVGFFEGPALPLIQSTVGRMSEARHRGRNLGIVVAGTNVIGIALAPAIMIGFGQALGWRATFGIVAIPGLLVALLVALFLKTDLVTGSADSKVSFRDFGRVLANRNVLLALIGSTVCIGYTIGFGAFATQYLAAVGRLAAGTIALVLTVYGIFVALGNVVAPALSDRIGRKPVIVIAAVCLGLVPLFFVFFAGQPSILIPVLAVGLLGGGTLALVTYVVPAESVPPTLTASAFALQISIGEILGGALGPQIGGAIADSSGLSSAMLFYAALPVLVVIAALLLRETAPRRSKSPSALSTLAAAPQVDVVP